MILPVLFHLQNKLIVSCQAEGDSPFNTAEGVAMFAMAAKMGGASGIRSEGIEKILKIKRSIDLPLIGLIKNRFPDGFVRITRTFEEVESLIQLNVDVIAIDGTFREVDGITGPEFIKQCKARYKNVCIMADISELPEAAACVKIGVDCISTALRGYTPRTSTLPSDLPDIEFIRELCDSFKDFPVIAEGKINSPAYAKEISELGVWSIVVGSAITRPQLITEWFVKSIIKSKN